MIAAVAPDPRVLIAGRVVMGIGAAASEPGTLSMIRQLYPGRATMARSLGIWAAVSSLGLGRAAYREPARVRMVVAGHLLVQRILRAVGVHQRRSRTSRELGPRVKARFDVGGAVLGATALGTVTFATILGETQGYGTWWIALLYAASLVAAIAFVFVELRVKNPVLNVRYFKRPAFAGSNVIACTVYFGTFAVFFFVALYVQVVGSSSPLRTALDFLPMAAGMVVASVFTGRWVAAWGPRLPMATGCLVGGVGILLTDAMIGPNAGVAQIGWPMFLAGVGIGIAMVPVTSAALGSVPHEHSGMAASTTNTSRELGAVVGVAVLGSIVNGQLTVNLVHRLTSIGIPTQYQSVVVSAVTTGTYQGGANAAVAKNPAIAHIVHEVVGAAYAAFGRGLDISLSIAGGLLIGSAFLALATVYGRRLHLERVNSVDGHLLHLTVEGRPGAEDEDDSRKPVVGVRPVSIPADNVSGPKKPV